MDNYVALEKLQTDIEKLMLQYEKETGAYVTSVELEVFDASTICGTRYVRHVKVETVNSARSPWRVEVEHSERRGPPAEVTIRDCE